MNYTVAPSAGLVGEITVPGDKSISHRAVMFGSLAEGTTEISGFLMGEDCLSTIACFRQMGVEIEIEEGKGAGPLIRVHGRGLEGLQEPADVLNVGNSGTTARLLLGILAGQPFFSALTGDGSIRRRPMGRVTKPLAAMGAQIYGRKEGTLAPLAVVGSPLQAIDYQSPVASAQVKSALILAGLYAEGFTTVTEPVLSRDHSERMLRSFGANIRSGGSSVIVEPRPKLTAQRIEVPGDISSAAFFLVAAAITPNSSVRIKGVGLNPTRDGVVEVLQAMGANLQVENRREAGGEPVADLVIESSSLKGTEIKGSLIPRLIDEIPVLAVAAACAQGETRIRDAEELKVKETDRIATVAAELRKFGVKVEELPDGMVIRGGGPLRGAVCQSHGDHRIAMAMAVAGLVAEGPTVIEGYEAVDVSFPGFKEILQKLSR